MAVEIIDLNELFHAFPLKIPARYCLPAFWFVRLALGLVGGALAVAEATSPVLALQIGAFAPVAIRAWTVGRKDVVA